MAKRLNLTEVLERGTPKQKALLIIQSDEESQFIGATPPLTEKEVQAIVKSVRKDSEEARAFYKYLDIAEKYSINRFRFYGLQENLKKLSARIAGYCQLWEQAEHEATIANTLLGLIDTDGVKGASTFAHRADVERYIYQSCRNWNKWTPIVRKKDSREVEVDTSRIRELLDSVIEDYRASLSVAKSIVEASDAFIDKFNASAFVPSDIKDIIAFFKAPPMDIPDIYRRDTYLQLLKEKGAEDREVQFRAKYAIVPAYEEIEANNRTSARELFKL
jgi:hypothetical protein